MHNLPDHELLKLVKSKDQAALSVLYDRYARLIYSFAMKSTKDPSAAREVVQSVYMRLWTTKSDFDPAKGKFSSWLLTITRNIVTDRIRQERRLAQDLQYESELVSGLPDAWAPSPEEMAIQSSVRRQIQQAYQYLSEQQIRLLDHFYWQGYSLSELAGLYNQPLGTIKNRLHQTLKVLRRHLVMEGENRDG